MVEPLTDNEAHPVAESEEVAGTLMAMPLLLSVTVAFVAPVEVPARPEPLKESPEVFSVIAALPVIAVAVPAKLVALMDMPLELAVKAIAPLLAVLGPTRFEPLN